MQILVADDHALYQKTLCEFLDTLPDVSICSQRWGFRSIQRTWWTSTARQRPTAQPGGFSGLAVDPRLAALKESRASGLSNHSGIVVINLVVEMGESSHCGI